MGPAAVRTVRSSLPPPASGRRAVNARRGWKNGAIDQDSLDPLPQTCGDGLDAEPVNSRARKRALVTIDSNGTHAPASAPDRYRVQQLGDLLSFSVYTADHVFAQLYRGALEKTGLTYPQYLVMVALWNRDGLRVKDLGDALFLDSGTLTPLLKRLEKAGFITRTRSERDQREVLIHLSLSGDALRSEAARIDASIDAALGLDSTALKQLQATVNDLRDRLYRRPGAAD